MNIKIYQIFYDDYSKAQIKPCCVPYDNSWYEGKPLKPAFENHCIIDIFKALEPVPDYVGVLSWKFQMKRPIKIEQAIAAITNDPDPADVYTFFKPMKHQMWERAEQWHPGIVAMAEQVFKLMGFQIRLLDIKNMPVIYMNAHITRTEIYRQFVDEWLTPFIKILTEEPSIQDMLNVNSRYQNQWVKKIHLVRASGKPYYTMHPFIAERLFSTWLSFLPEIKVKHLC